MAPKRPLPEQFMQPPRTCRRTINYAAQQNDIEDDFIDQQESENEFGASNKWSTTDDDDQTSRNAYISERKQSAQPPRKKCRRAIDHASQRHDSEDDLSDPHESGNAFGASNKYSTTDNEDRSDYEYGSEPEQSVQPPRKCRRATHYAAQQNDSEDDSNDPQDSDNDFGASNKYSTLEVEDDSDPEYGSESEASYKDNSSEADYQPEVEYKEARFSTKRISRAFGQAATPAKRILCAPSTAPKAIRWDVATQDSASSQATPSRRPFKATSTLAEEKPWIPLAELLKRQNKGRPENRLWVPLYRLQPITEYRNEKEAEDEHENDGGHGENDCDGDSDDDFADNDDDEAMTGNASDRHLLIGKSEYSIMDPRNPYSPANFRSCMEGLPEEESDDEDGGKTKRSTKLSRVARNEDFDSESESSEYTGDDEEEEDEEDS